MLQPSPEPSTYQECTNMLKAPTETRRPDSPSTLMHPSTPPSSPNLPSSASTVTLNAQQFFDAVKAVATAMRIDPTVPFFNSPPQTRNLGNSPSTIFSSTETASTAPCSLSLCHMCSMDISSSQSGFVQLAQQFLDVLKSLDPKKESPTPATPVDIGDFEEPPARTSKLEFKAVHEIWDAKMYKYKVVESRTPPDDIHELDQYIFIVRTRTDKKTENQTHHIDINSKGLRDVLRSILKDVKGICLREEKPSVEQNLLFHYLSDLEAYRRNHANLDESTLRHLDLFLDDIKKPYQLTTDRLDALLEKHEIAYDLLWTLFKPNTVVYTTYVGTGKPRCVKYDFGEEKKQTNGLEYFHIDCQYLDFDGKVFGEASTALGIEKFRGTVKINSLGAFPLAYHQKEKEARAYLSECGRKILELLKVHHCQYQGIAFYISKNRPVKLFVNSRIVVDSGYFREANPNYVKASIDDSKKESSSGNGWIVLGGDDNPERSSDSVKSNGMDPSAIKGDDLLICSPTVLGFSLGIKMWAEFAVDDIQDVNWQPEALSCLQIPEKKKRAIQALLEAHMRRASTDSFSFDDLVSGKGLGFNVLMHGPPGAGKTLTAEVLSEYFQMALYTVSAGELGRTAEDLEHRLPLIFERAARWNALLLDEADVFLEQRSNGNIDRNALLCVFLRTLEYFQGVMFFTTNRVKQIDPAIASRIHFKIKYDDLDRNGRRVVWEYFLRKATTPQGPPVFSRRDLEFLVEKSFNGREIKNLTSTAQALALKEGIRVTISYLEFAIEASVDFERDVNGVGLMEALNGYF